MLAWFSLLLVWSAAAVRAEIPAPAQIAPATALAFAASEEKSPAPAASLDASAANLGTEDDDVCGPAPLALDERAASFSPGEGQRELERFPARLADRRPATLVGSVVLLI